MSTNNWRDHLDIHPACAAYPELSRDELIRLGNDIREHGLQSEIVVLLRKVKGEHRFQLLDGRSRLDAMAAVGIEFSFALENPALPMLHFLNGEYGNEGAAEIKVVELPDDEVEAFVASANLHRRHLTAKQKDERAAALLKAKPESSNAQIAKQTGRDDKTIAKIRRKLEATSEIPRLGKRTGKDGKARPAKAKKRAVPPAPARCMCPLCDQDRSNPSVPKAANDAEPSKPAEAETTPGAADDPEASAALRKQHCEAAAKQAGESLEGAGADPFFAALQFAPKLKAEIERRVLRQHTALNSIKPKHDKDATNLLRKGLGTRAPAKQIHAIGQLNQLLDRRGLTRDDVKVTLPQAKRG